MGVVNSIGFDKFPKQGTYLGKRVNVCFNYNTSKQIAGTVVREDVEEPGVMIIRLDDTRHVLSTECQWQPWKESK